MSFFVHRNIVFIINIVNIFCSWSQYPLVNTLLVSIDERGIHAIYMLITFNGVSTTNGEPTTLNVADYLSV